MAQELAASKNKRSIKYKTPSATDHVFVPADSVLVWRERIVNKRVGEFIGPFIVLAFDPLSKNVIVDQNRTKKRYTTAQVAPYKSEPEVLHDLITELNMQGVSNEDDNVSATALNHNIAHAKQTSKLGDIHIEERNRTNKKESMKCKPIAEHMRVRSQSIQERGMVTL